ncbi:MAG: DNA glycosylase [Verrucomicrobiales bacterium]|nr:DNA glycosylase [Verrucomicrobiales bacterium]
MSISPPIVEVPFEPPFSLADTLKSGQLFHWEELTLSGVPGFAGCIGDSGPCWIGQTSEDCVVTLEGQESVVSRYFGLDQPLAAIHASFPKDDPVLTTAIDYCPGIRVARQPVWECLATFITSSLKQVVHIRSISMTLRRRYGKVHLFAGREFFAYPDPAAIAAAGEENLRKCALGYRAKSLSLAGAAISSGEVDLAEIEEVLAAREAKAALMELHGVGEKIANCTLLFSCGQWGAFPIDVWIERILREHYRKRLKGAKLQAWAEDYFGPNAGYAQQYLFHYARKTL